MDAPMLTAVPIELRAANEFVGVNHRHHVPIKRDKYRVGCMCDGRLVGVVQVGHPVARCLCDGKTLEVVRLCTDGTTKGVCSFLYSRAARIAKELGYSKIITYILDSESGTSLKAAGWEKEDDTKGREWGCPSRPREVVQVDLFGERHKYPVQDKQRWARVLRGEDATDGSTNHTVNARVLSGSTDATHACDATEGGDHDGQA